MSRHGRKPNVLLVAVVLAIIMCICYAIIVWLLAEIHVI